MNTKTLHALTYEQRLAIQAAQCPCCQYGLPEVYHVGTDRPGYNEHYLPGTDFKMKCAASAFRRALYEASVVEEHKAAPADGA